MAETARESSWRGLVLLLLALLSGVGWHPLVAPAMAASAPDGLIASPERGWPQWRGECRDGLSGESGLLPAWPPEGPKLLWKVENLGRGWSSPIIAGGLIYVTGDVGDDLVIYAFDLDGRPRWQAKNGASWKGPYPGARAGCAYSAGRLFHMNAHGRVACLDAATGREVWAVDVLQRFGAKNLTWATSECLLVDGPRVIVTPGGSQTMMAALDKSDGHTVWMSGPLETDDAAYSSPILFRAAGRRLIANCSSKHGFGVDADTGKLLWAVPVTNPFRATVATPIYGDGCVFYVSPDGPGATCVRILPDGAGVRAAQVWHSAVLDSLTGGGILVDGLLYASGYKKKSWHCFDWRTGERKFGLADLVSGAALYADGRLICFCEDGTAALLKPNPDGAEVAGRFQPAEVKRRDAWAHPVLLDGRLYLRYHETLWCYDVRKR